MVIFGWLIGVFWIFISELLVYLILIVINLLSLCFNILDTSLLRLFPIDFIWDLFLGGLNDRLPIELFLKSRLCLWLDDKILLRCFTLQLRIFRWGFLLQILNMTILYLWNRPLFRLISCLIILDILRIRLMIVLGIKIIVRLELLNILIYSLILVLIFLCLIIQT